MTRFLPHIAFFVVVRFSLASSLAVDLAFALALISILALSFALVLTVAAAFACALASALFLLLPFLMLLSKFSTSIGTVSLKSFTIHVLFVFR